MTTPVNMPVTTLDQRFSDPDADATSWDAARQALETAEMFWISTVRADGRPHVTPLVAVWADGALYFCTGDAEQKAVNLGANPHVVLTTGCSDWEGGLDVMVEGDAVQVTDDVTLRRLAQAWTTKWDGRWQYQVRDGHFSHPDGEEPILVFEVSPAKVLAFTKGTFTHTRHRF
jgi:nitroimidazol reductase NimA-like FMN-containing flavoprotein (pyridoxamine 5'-phosphate oxidase superfamily)